MSPKHRLLSSIGSRILKMYFGRLATAIGTHMANASRCTISSLWKRQPWPTQHWPPLACCVMKNIYRHSVVLTTGSTVEIVSRYDWLILKRELASMACRKQGLIAIKAPNRPSPHLWTEVHNVEMQLVVDEALHAAEGTEQHRTSLEGQPLPGSANGRH